MEYIHVLKKTHKNHPRPWGGLNDLLFTPPHLYVND